MDFRVFSDKDVKIVYHDRKFIVCHRGLSEDVSRAFALLNIVTYDKAGSNCQLKMFLVMLESRNIISGPSALVFFVLNVCNKRQGALPTRS
jgi:hypothetical protein